MFHSAYLAVQKYFGRGPCYCIDDTSSILVECFIMLSHAEFYLNVAELPYSQPPQLNGSFVDAKGP